MSLFSRLYRRLRYVRLKIWDPRRIAEEAGERVVFQYLRSEGFLNGFEEKRILEIGPKHGKDSLLLAGIKPCELVLLDLPEKNTMVEQWLSQIPYHPTYVQGNLLYLTQEEQDKLGQFDLIWCLGVLYHNVEQLRLIKRLYNLCKPNGKIVIESAITRNKRLQHLNIVELHWPNPYRNVPTITHLPSRTAIKCWLEMSGFSQVELKDIYSKHLAPHRAVLTGIKTQEVNPYQYYNSEINPTYIVGEAT